MNLNTTLKKFYPGLHSGAAGGMDDDCLDEFLNQVYDRISEMMTDHATNKTAVDTSKTLTDELRTDHATVRTWLVESDADQDAINNYLDFLNEADGVIEGSYSMAGTAAVTVLGAGRVRYRIDGVEFETVLDTTITIEDNGDVTQNKWGAWRVLIDGAGAVTTQSAASGGSAFNSAEDALLGLSAIAQTASTACIGYFTITDSGGAFNIGTTNTSGGTATTVVYDERMPRKKAAGLSAALGASIALDAASATYNTGTIDAKVLGVNLTQIGAQTTQAFDDADTVATTKFGGWVICTDLAGTDIYALAANGVAGAVSAMAYDSSALAQTAIDNVVDRLPSIFCPIGQLIIEQGTGTFTAGTTNLDDAQTTATFADFTVGSWGRTSLTGADSHKVNPPAVPATITAPIVATITAVAATAGPATLSSTTLTDPDA